MTILDHNNPGRPMFRASVLALLYASSASANWYGSDSTTDLANYGNSLNRDWLYDSGSISLQVDGCVWGYVSDNEEAGCLEDSSEDGTTYWYQMANCRRAQVAFSMYGSDSSSTSCSSTNFKESFVTVDGLSNFIAYMSEYDANNPFGDNAQGDDQVEGGDYDDLPMCEQTNYGYVGVGCADDGTFALQYFNDAYCQQPTGKTYNSLDNLNQAMSTYTGCSGIWYNGNDNSLSYYLMSMSESCSSLDSGYCVDNEAMKDRRSHSGSHHMGLSSSFAGKSWLTKLKFAVGGLLLLGSFVIFTGILFTNRRRRRALLQRKYRQSRRDSSRKKASSRSKSKSRKSSSRSRSRAKEETAEGVYA